MAGAGFGLVTVFAVALPLVLGCAVAGRFVRPVPATSGPPVQGLAGRAAFLGGAVVIALTALSALLVATRTTWTPDADTVALWASALPASSTATGSGSASAAGTTPTTRNTPRSSRRCTRSRSPSAAASTRPCFRSSSTCSASPSSQRCSRRSDRCVSRSIAFPSVALLIVAPEFFSRLDSLLPDQTLAYFVATAGLACVLWLRERRGSWLALASLLSAAGTLTKGEGLSYAVLLTVVVACAAVLRGRRAAVTALVLLAGVLAIEPWRLCSRRTASRRPPRTTASRASCTLCTSRTEPVASATRCTRCST